MGRGPRYWFPLALLGFAQLGLAVVQLLSRRSPVGASVNVGALLTPGRSLGTGGVGGTGYAQLQWLSQDDYYAPGAGLPAGPLWLGALGVALAGTAVWYALALRPARTGWFVLGTIAALLAIPLLDLVGSWQFRLGDGLRGPLLATLGLLVLAAYERSVLVLVTAALFAVFAVVLSADLVGVLLGAIVLLAAAFAALLRHRRDTA
ncbi:hypothetical protein H4696_003605 [Amycolatopsis lexingtonensis]|uniref:Uncharacterized protein n=1 Tax=Amycolatopsis lexingtonensis TaxID=218822 RepID=A0ABR9I018_9PSEU|nr:hypothetical protein [Amycolatopsis lexingtonensis]MBE1496505.1 hypothetical protein [Amycolatopsis lexingtonensis]